MSVEERPVCSICTEEILPGADVSKLNCTHQYHRECLLPWLNNHNTCPLDRRRITSINGVPLEQPEMQEPVHVIEVENPLREAQALYHSIRVIHHPSIDSADPVEHTAAKVRSVLFFRFPPC